MRRIKHRTKRRGQRQTGARQSDLVYFQTHGRRTRAQVTALVKRRESEGFKRMERDFKRSARVED